MNPEFEKVQRNGRIWGGLILIGVGSALLARKLGVIMPTWLFTWPIILILVGIYTLGKHGFKRPGGLIPLAVGGVFLADMMMPGVHISNIAWPALIIVFGLFMLLRPKRNWKERMSQKWEQTESTPFSHSMANDEDYIMVDSVFGGAQRQVISKNFKGGQINTVFGGAQINLLQADIVETAVIDINAVFGGVEIAVPSTWNVKNELNAILGGVDDKRPYSENTETSKVLVLKGSVTFGGISIKGY